MTLDNDAWLKQLTGGGPAQQEAIALLRETLVRNLHRALVSSPVADHSFIEDTAQDALMRILDRLSQFEGRSRFLTWATSIAVRVAMTELRRRRWKDVSLEDLHSRFDLAPPVSGAPPSGDSSERQTILLRMYEIIETELTERQRTVLLGELRGVSQDAIVEHLGTNRNAVYKLGHDARRKLKERLEASGFHAEDIHAAFVA